MMNFQKISEIIPKVLAHKNLAGVSRTEETKHKFSEVLREIFGTVTQKVEITDLKNGVVYLQVSDNILAQKIQLSSEILLEKMRKMGFADIKKIYSKIENS